MHTSGKNILPVIILASLAVTWGSSFILIKRALEYFTPQEVGALRIVITFLFFIPFAIVHFKTIKKKHILYLAIVGIIGSTIPAFLFAYAETGIDSSLAGILNSLTPLFTFIISFSFFKYRAKWFNVIGLIIAFTGAMGLITYSGEGHVAFNFKYASYIILAAICYAINVNVIKYKLSDLKNISVATFGFILAGIPTTVYLYVYTPFLHSVTSQAQILTGMGYLALLSILGTAIALIAFYYLIKISSTVFSSSVTYLIPIVAVLWGIFDGEVFKASYMIWITFILSGIYLVNTNSLSLWSGRKTHKKK